jgi:2-desacetyl-2-hydroxyethyl bacteriochlorophyllide A dehydrogenase
MATQETRSSEAPRDSGATARALWFTQPRVAELRSEPLRDPGPDEVLVRAITSIVSAGSEMRVYRGQVDPEMSLGLDVFAGSFSFPVKFAYQVVGEVEAAGPRSSFQAGDRVFVRHPHQERFVVRNEPFILHRLPHDLAPERAVFSNLLDVAYNAQLDVPVRIGETVVVYGQGIIGSFCAQLARRTAGVLIVVDPIEQRRRAAVDLGADAAVTPAEAGSVIDELTKGRGADISIEVSGAPEALQQALQGAAQEGTVSVVSFFGGRQVPLVLSPEFHYRRLRIISSQVRHIAGALQPRWSMERRMEAVHSLLADPGLVAPISHVIPFDDAPRAYRTIDEQPESTAGVLLTYGGYQVSGWP